MNANAALRDTGRRRCAISCTGRPEDYEPGYEAFGGPHQQASTRRRRKCGRAARLRCATTVGLSQPYEASGENREAAGCRACRLNKLNHEVSGSPISSSSGSRAPFCRVVWELVLYFLPLPQRQGSLRPGLASMINSSKYGAQMPSDPVAFAVANALPAECAPLGSGGSWQSEWNRNTDPDRVADGSRSEPPSGTW